MQETDKEKYDTEVPESPFSGTSALAKNILNFSKKVLTPHMERAIIIELPEKQKQNKRRQEP